MSVPVGEKGNSVEILIANGLCLFVRQELPGNFRLSLAQHAQFGLDSGNKGLGQAFFLGFAEPVNGL